MPTKSICINIDGEEKNVQLSLFGISFYMSHAASTDDLEAVKALIQITSDHDIDVLANSEELHHIIVSAASSIEESNQFRVAAYLIHMGINFISGVTMLGWSPLHTLCHGLKEKSKINDKRKHVLDSIIDFELKTGEKIMHFSEIDADGKPLRRTPYEILADDYKDYYNQQKQRAQDERYERSRVVADDVKPQDVRQAFSQDGPSSSAKQGVLAQMFSSIFGTKTEISGTSSRREMPMNKIKVK